MITTGFILIWFLNPYFNSATSGSAEFNTLKACEVAKEKIYDFYGANIQNKNVLVLCVPKG